MAFRVFKNFQAVLAFLCNYRFRGMDKVLDRVSHTGFEANQFESFTRPLLLSLEIILYLRRFVWVVVILINLKICGKDMGSY